MDVHGSTKEPHPFETVSSTPPLMLPFNVMGELSRTLALAVRLFGNIMSGMKIAAILLTVSPSF
jgi:F0F1-type ATP synthase membrane subunit a